MGVNVKFGYEIEFYDKSIRCMFLRTTPNGFPFVVAFESIVD